MQLRRQRLQYGRIIVTVLLIITVVVVGGVGCGGGGGGGQIQVDHALRGTGHAHRCVPKRRFNRSNTGLHTMQEKDRWRRHSQRRSDTVVQSCAVSKSTQCGDLMPRPGDVGDQHPSGPEGPPDRCLQLHGLSLAPEGPVTAPINLTCKFPATWSAASWAASPWRVGLPQ